MRLLSLVAAALVMLAAAMASALAQTPPPRGWLGAELKDLTKPEADALGFEGPRGAKVATRVEGGPAARAGLQAGDVIVSLDGVEVESAAAFDAAIAGKAPGVEVKLRLLREKRERRLSVVLAPEPAAPARVAAQELLLMLDTGGHMAKIQNIAFTPDGAQLVSAADDKVIRVWDLASGRTVRTIRGEVGPGDEGKIYAMALSPDGTRLAAAGFMAAGFGTRDDAVGDVRIYDFATGELLTLLRGHDNAVNALAFSKDGRRLVSGSGDSTAMIWDAGEGSGEQAWRRPRRIQHLKGHRDQLYAAGFMPDGERVITASIDRSLRIWRIADGKELAHLTGHRAHVVRALGVRASDGMIASGDRSGEIRIWDGATGRHLSTLKTPSVGIGVLAFSPDGSLLIACSGTVSGGHIATVWRTDTWEEVRRYQQHDNIILATMFTRDGQLVATAGGNDRVIRIWDPRSGETRHVLKGVGRAVFAAGFSMDQKRLAWGHSDRGSVNSQREPFEHQVALPVGPQKLGRPVPVAIQLPPPPRTGGIADPARPLPEPFVRARAVHGSWQLAHKVGGNRGLHAILEIIRDGQVQASIERGPTDGDDHRAYTFTPDGQTVISGGSWGVLTAYDLAGKEKGRFVGHDSEIWAIAASPDGRFLISGSDDQTVRLWNLKTTEPIVTLFYGTDGEWVMWTPQGYYMGSAGADKIVGWQINKGPEKAPEYIGAAQLRQHLNRPDIVEKAIELGSAEEAIRRSHGTTFKLADLLNSPPPRLKILSPLPGSTEHGGRTTLKIAIERVPDPVKLIRVQVNGRQVAELTAPIGAGGFPAGERNIDVPLERGRNEIVVTALNAVGWSRAEDGRLVVSHSGAGRLDRRGTLYLIAIGVDKYPKMPRICGEDGKQTCDLTYSGTDARAFVAAVEARIGHAHEKVVRRLVTHGADADAEPTAINILDAVDLLKSTKENDTIVVFVAGHGINEGDSYRFLPTDAELTATGWRGATLVHWSAVQEAVEAAKGRRILFLDTCHSGNAWNKRLENTSYHANIIAYTAARWDQLASERNDLVTPYSRGRGHGLFTYAIVEGLEGKAAGEKRELSTRQLADYVSGRVMTLAAEMRREQMPQYLRGRDAEDYVLARW